MSQSALGGSAAGRLLSLEDWSAMPEDEPGEFVDGRIEEEEVSDFVHELIVGWLIEALRRWVVTRGGFVFGSDAKYAVQPSRGRKPDVSVFLVPDRPPPRRGPCRIPPDIMVEVVSATPRDERRDRVEKLKEYAAFGVRFYWLVDPELRTFEILELDPHSRFAHVVSATDGIVSVVPGCEGLVLDLDALWREADRLAVQ